MRIGFDAKRIFFNRSGLGAYSRDSVALLSRYCPGHDYLLFSPREGNPVGFDLPEGVRTLYPEGIFRRFPSLWRSYSMSGSLRRHGVDIYHGLSNELPADIRRAEVRSVVTIHDLIFVRYPQLYKPIDRWLYTRKYARSCRDADRIIAVSGQTRDDLVAFWKIPPEKIDVVYQGCNPIFYDKATDEELSRVRKKYALPEHYLLSVGTVEERKNLLLAVQAIAERGIDTELVVCGRRTPYADRIGRYAADHGVANRIHFLSGVETADLPALYQMAGALVYASLFEGFGIPILEGLNSGIPVITTRGGVFPETGGDACLYVDPTSTEQMADAIERALGDSVLRAELVERGFRHAARFRQERIAADLMRVYRSLL